MEVKKHIFIKLKVRNKFNKLLLDLCYFEVFRSIMGNFPKMENTKNKNKLFTKWSSKCVAKMELN